MAILVSPGASEPAALPLVHYAGWKLVSRSGFCDPFSLNKPHAMPGRTIAAAAVAFMLASANDSRICAAAVVAIQPNGGSGR